MDKPSGIWGGERVGNEKGPSRNTGKMTISEAIKILTIHNDHNPNFTDGQRRIAHQLGIEALKRVKGTRDKRFPVLGEELPGEIK